MRSHGCAGCRTCPHSRNWRAPANPRTGCAATRCSARSSRKIPASARAASAGTGFAPLASPDLQLRRTSRRPGSALAQPVAGHNGRARARARGARGRRAGRPLGSDSARHVVGPHTRPPRATAAGLVPPPSADGTGGDLADNSASPGSTCCGCARPAGPARHAVPDRGRGMSLRPQVAHWFELLTSREELGATLDCLAQTGRWQLPAYQQIGIAARTAGPAARAERIRNAGAAVTRPGGRSRISGAPDPQQPLTEVPQKAIERLARLGSRRRSGRGRTRAHRAVARRDAAGSATAGRRAVTPCRNWIVSAAAGPVLGSRVYMLPTGGPPLSLPATVISQSLAANDATFLVAVGAQSDMGDLDQVLMARKGRVVGLPADLPAGPGSVAGGARAAAARARRSANDRRARRWPHSASDMPSPARSAKSRWPPGYMARISPSCRSPSISPGSPGGVRTATRAGCRPRSMRADCITCCDSPRRRRAKCRHPCCAIRAGRGRSRCSRG